MMGNLVNSYIEKFLHERRVHRLVLTILLVLATVVAVVVFWQLHSDGVAMASETFCGEEEHLHGE